MTNKMIHPYGICFLRFIEQWEIFKVYKMPFHDVYHFVVILYELSQGKQEAAWLFCGLYCLILT